MSGPLCRWGAVLFGIALCSPNAAVAGPCPSGALTIGTDATFPPFESKVGDSYVGYEIDLGEQLAARLGCTAVWVNASFDGIFPALLAGRYDMVIAATTITEERQKSMLFSDPYIDAGQSIAQRDVDPAYLDIEALRGRRVGVGLNTTGQFLLEPYPDITLLKYPSIDLALTDLRAGRLDAAVGDRPAFAYMIHESFPDLELRGAPLNQEQWGVVFAPERAELRDEVNRALKALRGEGFITRLDEKWLGMKAEAPAVGPPSTGLRLDRLRAAAPVLLLGAKWTLGLSFAAFLLALPLGLGVAVLRGARSPWVRRPAAAWVELIRGTPLLVQIFFIYFVLPNFGIAFSDVTTAVLALAINASAYIGEILRAGLESLDAGQSEAAAALGLSRSETLRHVLVPQTVRRVVPPLTNEAIALIKESSLVSVMGMTELTRSGQELASRYADPLTIWPGVALTYLLMTVPLSRLSAALERRLRVGTRTAEPR